MIQEIKSYMRVDEAHDDVLINSLIKSAEIYLENAGVEVKYEVELYKVAIQMLVLHWYENREIVGKADRLTFALDNILTQLIYCYEVE